MVSILSGILSDPVIDNFFLPTSSSIIDDLEKSCTPTSTDSCYVLAYWYFTFNNRDSIDIDNLLSSMIRQLCAGAQKLPKKVHELWSKHYMAGSRPTRASLIDTLNTIVVGLSTNGQHAFVVLDALDEYPLASRQDTYARQQISKRGDVLQWLHHFCASNSNVHVLVLSRDENDIRSRMSEASKVDVAKCVNGDLNMFVEKYIDRIFQEAPWKYKYNSQLLARFQSSGQRQVQSKLRSTDTN